MARTEGPGMMPGKPLICTAVCDRNDNHIVRSIKRLMIEKKSGKVAYAMSRLVAS